uniref:Uncharacterized protein n=1 Tax=Phasianus colchicus TaxID=9054 RepID=A0A669PHG2_PHACC
MQHERLCAEPPGGRAVAQARGAPRCHGDGPPGAEAVAAASGSAWRRRGAERAMPLVVLCGPPGSGKSRRAAELRDALGGAERRAHVVQLFS